MRPLYVLFFVVIFFVGVFPVGASEVDGTITPSPQHAYGENLGWINFACDNCDVHITDTALTGHVWSRRYGWINLAPDGSGVTNNCAGQLGGKAWSRTLGWVDFSGASIDADGVFTGTAGTPGTDAGRVNFGCDNCGVATDWLQCSLRESPAQVVINAMTDTIIPDIVADITITNEGAVDTEYQYEWCVVTGIGNACGGGDDVFYASAAKLIVAGEDWDTTKTATVPDPGTYYFKLVVYYGVNYSTASQVFTATAASSGGGGGGGGTTSDTYDTADLNRDHKVDSIDFSILLYSWKKNPPFANAYVDINRDDRVDSVDFSIMLSQWGRTTL